MENKFGDRISFFVQEQYCVCAFFSVEPLTNSVPAKFC